jgi:hypothetical protein
MLSSLTDWKVFVVVYDYVSVYFPVVLPASKHIQKAEKIKQINQEGIGF